MEEADTNSLSELSSEVVQVVVVGEINVDLILENTNRLPELGKERIVEGMTLTLGSSSAILASNLNRLGTSVGFVGRVGTDAFGDYCLEVMKARGLDVQHVIESEDTATGLTAIYTYEGERGMLTYPGAMEELTLADMPWDDLAQAGHLHLSSYYLQPGLRPDCPALFRKAKEKGLSTSFDTNWDPDEEWGTDVLEVLDHVDVFLPNDQEALLISGEEDLSRALEVLAERAGAVVVTCGADGAKARTGERVLEVPAPSVEPVDAVGAGDSFNAGFLHRYVQGGSLEESLLYGSLTGAFSTLAAGGTTAFEDRKRFEDFASEQAAQLTVTGDVEVPVSGSF